MIRIQLNEKGKQVINSGRFTDRIACTCRLGYDSLDELRICNGFNVEYTGILTAVKKEEGIYRFNLECRTTEDKVQTVKEVGISELSRIKSALKNDFGLEEDSYLIL